MAKRTLPRAAPKHSRTESMPKRGRGTALPRNLGQASLADHEQMLNEIFRVILEFSRNSGVSHDRAARVFAHARRTVDKTPYRLSDALHFEIMTRIGDVLKAWYTEPEYLDARGVPAPLPLSGARSVERLIRRFMPKVDARDTVRWLIAEGVFRQHAQGRLLPTRRMISFTQANAMILDRIPLLLQGLLSTFSHNFEVKVKGGETRCEHSLTLDQFPLKEVPRFSREVKRLVPMLLDQLESWAAPYLRAAERKSQKTARVGVEVFGYVEEHAPRAKVRGHL